MLGEMRSDIKALMKANDTFFKSLEDHDGRIDHLEKGEVARLARSGIFGAIGGVIITGVWPVILSKLGFK